MHTTTVGVLLPTSGIRPMSKQFLKAFNVASSEALKDTGYELEVLTEMIGNGSHDQIDKALNRFFGFHEAQLVIGMATRYGLQHSFDKFQKRKAPLIVCGLGEHFIPTKGFNDHILINAIHLWQQNWYLGYYAGQHLGGKGMAFASMYDSGYSFLSAFQQGVFDANPDIDFRFKLLPMTEGGQLSPVKEAFDQLDFAGQDFVYTMLCGEEATLFLEAFKERGLHEETSLLGMPFLLEPGEVNLSGVSVYSTHHQVDEAAKDPDFKEVFAQLGHITGDAVARAVLKGKGQIDREVMEQALKEADPHKVYSSVSFPKLTSPIGIVKHTFGEDNLLSTESIEQQEIDLDDNEALNALRDSVSASWVNPYLAI